MRVVPVSYSGMFPIEGYGPGFFRISGEVQEGMIAVLPSGVTSWQGMEDSRCICAARDEIDLLLVGTGPNARSLPERFCNAVGTCGIEVEAMPTPAACRTYNVLLAEGRRVAVALMPV